MPASTRKILWAFLAAWAACVIGGYTWLSLRQSHRERMRAEALPISVNRAAPIIAEIADYTDKHGNPPPSLAALVPSHLAQLPDAGPAAEDGWHYSTNEDKNAGGWSLSIRVRHEYSPNIAGFGDRFVFLPGGRYPDKAYDGVLMPFGKWGYYAE